jgi:TRAP-type mannitol/chloroaromatic compound transport system permease large subunit
MQMRAAVKTSHKVDMFGGDDRLEDDRIKVAQRSRDLVSSIRMTILLGANVFDQFFDIVKSHAGDS